ncbi:hypothetical protein NDU88_000004 [Pleurodeles waltl]|uniref:Uncharacterized protein n=1 Tax=Pleurodeles waltl TaxID=8319 RepID=A0AAV7SV79_PLEWA|nr:hypothetical protein NDU88_000004 [Pleurodeles waltl]
MWPHSRGPHSDIPAGPAGANQVCARRPSGNEAATQEPAPNGAGGVAAVRRVQLHPSRFSLSPMQTVKSWPGPC